MSCIEDEKTLLQEVPWTQILHIVKSWRKLEND